MRMRRPTRIHEHSRIGGKRRHARGTLLYRKTALHAEMRKRRRPAVLSVDWQQGETMQFPQPPADFRIPDRRGSIYRYKV